MRFAIRWRWLHLLMLLLFVVCLWLVFVRPPRRFSHCPLQCAGSSLKLPVEREWQVAVPVTEGANGGRTAQQTAPAFASSRNPATVLLDSTHCRMGIARCVPSAVQRNAAEQVRAAQNELALTSRSTPRADDGPCCCTRCARQTGIDGHVKRVAFAHTTKAAGSTMNKIMQTVAANLSIPYEAVRSIRDMTVRARVRCRHCLYKAAQSVFWGASSARWKCV
jgi:hypothetical protein